MNRQIKPKILKVSTPFYISKTFNFDSGQQGIDFEEQAVYLVDLDGVYFVFNTETRNSHAPPTERYLRLEDFAGQFCTGDLLYALVEFRSLCDKYHCNPDQ